MDPLTLVAGLFGMGKYFSHARNKEQAPRVFDRIPDRVRHDEQQRVDRLVARQVAERWQQAQDPIQSRIIPHFFKHQKTISDLEFVPNANHEPDAAAKLLQLSVKDRMRIHYGKGGKTPQVAQPRSSVPSNNLAGIEQIGGSLLPDRDLNQESHTNMIPFYRGTITEPGAKHDRLSTGKLQSFTGQTPRPPKHEIGPMFKPSPNLGNVFGTHEKRDLSRYLASATGKKHNALPFEQIRVGPGMNDGYTAQPSGGYHNSLQIRPKRTDELFINTNFEREGRINHGRAQNGLRPAVQRMAQNRPKVLVENLHGERNLTSLAAVQGPTIHPKHREKPTNRMTANIAYGGIAGPATQKNHRRRPKGKLSLRQNYYQAPSRNATITYAKRHHDYGQSTYANRPNERSSTSEVTHLLNPMSWIKRMRTYLTDAPRKTRKQYYIDNPRQSGYLKGERQGQHVPLGNKAKTTVRETTEDLDHRGIASASRHRGIVYDPHHKAKTTVRETTENNDHRGIAAPVKRRGVVYDAAHKARTTVRETTEDRNHQGWIRGQDRGTAHDKTWTAKRTTKETTVENRHRGHLNAERLGSYTKSRDKARTTIKEMTEDTDHRGIAAPLKKKSIVYDPSHKARMTVKQTTEDLDHRGIAAPAKQRGIVYDPKHKARKTTKETTHSSHTGQVNRGLVQGAHGYTVRPVKAKNTNKQFTSDNEYVGVARSTQQQKPMSQDAAYNANLNDRKEKIARGRYPTPQSTKMANHGINMKSAKRESDRRNRFSPIKTNDVGYAYGGYDQGAVTTEKNYLPQDDVRLDPDLLKPFKANPLTQSLASY